MPTTRRHAIAACTFAVLAVGPPAVAAPSGGSPGRPTAVHAPDSLRAPLTRERFYFVMPDRFQNGDPTNDLGGLSGPREATGFDPTSKGWYHGGDLRGLIQELDYIKGLGTTALWLTPSFKNKPVQGLGTPFPSAGYHGYWITDFTQVDPHLGTNDDLRALIRGAHRRGMKVFFDIITNHTADVIGYREGRYDYVPKSVAPYKDAAGNPFDDRDYAGGDTFPALDPALSFPLTPFVRPEEQDVKVPGWLNDVRLYHNRGNTTFSGENSTYGDFFGLDDLFTEHPDVVRGMTEIYSTWIRDFGIDGFRIDTMKHVNLEFWQRFLPDIAETARQAGKPDFFAFGEEADPGAVPFLSRYTTAGQAQAVLDFPFQQQAREFVGQDRPPAALARLFARDDWYTDADSNVYQLPTFLGNHDMGHIGMFLRDDTRGAPEAELLARDVLAHELLYLSRGQPVIYFGDEQGFTGAGNDQAARQDMFPSQDLEYDNLDNDPTDPTDPSNDAGRNDNIGSDVTPMADNFDRTHPLYRTISRLARLTRQHHALRDGAQQTRYAADEPGILAFSRTNARARVEYLVVLNNAETPKTASFATYSPRMRFERIWGDGARSLRSGADRTVEVTVPGLSAVVYRADGRIARSTSAPAVDVRVATEVRGRPELSATVDGTSLYQVTFAVRAANTGAWTNLGTDDNAPYRVFPDLSAYAAGTRLQFRAVVKDNAGHVRQATARSRVSTAAGSGAGTAVIHYRRPAGDYAGWGLHLWGDAIAEGVGTTWDAPRAPTRFDDFGAVFEIPLADAAASLNYIIHTPSGDVVPTTREPGGDRTFVPEEVREVWIVAGDPTIHATRPSP